MDTFVIHPGQLNLSSPPPSPHGSPLPNTNTHPHTHARFPLWCPQVILQQMDLKRMQGGANNHGETRHLHQTLKVGLFGAHLRALALGGGGAVGLSRLDKCACYETLTHIYPRCLPMKNSGSCSGWYTPSERRMRLFLSLRTSLQPKPQVLQSAV